MNPLKGGAAPLHRKTLFPPIVNGPYTPPPEFRRLLDRPPIRPNGWFRGLPRKTTHPVGSFNCRHGETLIVVAQGRRGRFVVAEVGR